MNIPAKLMTRPAVACVLLGLLAAWTLTALGAEDERYALARKVYKGNAPIAKISGPLATVPNKETASTITPNTPIWFLPAARPGPETPVAKTGRLKTVHVRPTILAREYAFGDYQDQLYPELRPETPLAQEHSPDSSELSVPPVLAGPVRQDANRSSDPTSVQSRLAVLLGRPILRQTPAAFLRLDIPTPFGLTDAIKLPPAEMPTDNDPPTTPKKPTEPTLPIKTRN
ncbi:MAG: hypothetical protein HN350_10695 [Phycisphaerales bacterium]|jgi:hypothetical protein|nr:hypothetical protein [Phycisphaerales bacterium]